MLKYIWLILLNAFIWSHISSSGQSIIRSSINSLGSSSTENGIIIRQTLGQSSNTSVFNNEAVTLRQGFQQPLYSRQDITLANPFKFTLYPNPATGKTLLSLEGDISSYDLTIYNINGIEVIRINDLDQKTRWVDLNYLIPGIYIVTITANRKTGSQKLIIKY